MAFFKTQLLIFKTYRGKRFSIQMRSNGMDPQGVVVKVFGTKKPKAEITVETGWFSDSRGYGGTSTRKLTLTDPGAVEICRGVLADDAALGALIDWVGENYASLGGVSDRLPRWWLLAQQENPSQFVTKERRELAFADKKFAAGEKVLYTHTYPARVVELTGERFDWTDYFGGGWRFSFPGVDAPQHYFRKLNVAEVIAAG